MKTWISWPFLIRAKTFWLRTFVMAAITVPVIMFAGCARKKAIQIMHRAPSNAPASNIASGSTNMHRLFGQLSIGMSEQHVASVVEPIFYRIETGTYIDKYPFRDLLPELNPLVVSEWRTSQLEPDGWPDVFFAIFEDDSKTNLVDAFWFENGSLSPVVDGRFQHNLRAVKMGDSIDVVYRLLGKRAGEYFRDSDSKWHIKFIYWTYQGRIFVIEGDAAEGRVIRAGDGTL